MLVIEWFWQNISRAFEITQINNNALTWLKHQNEYLPSIIAYMIHELLPSKYSQIRRNMNQDVNIYCIDGLLTAWLDYKQFATCIAIQKIGFMSFWWQGF